MKEAAKRVKERQVNFEEKYQRQQIERNSKLMQAQKKKHEEESKHLTFKPKMYKTQSVRQLSSEDSGDDTRTQMRKTNQRKVKKLPNKDEGLIGVPQGNRVEDRLMNQGKLVQDKK